MNDPLPDFICTAPNCKSSWKSCLRQYPELAPKCLADASGKCAWTKIPIGKLWCCLRGYNSLKKPSFAPNTNSPAKMADESSTYMAENSEEIEAAAGNNTSSDEIDHQEYSAEEKASIKEILSNNTKSEDNEEKPKAEATEAKKPAPAHNETKSEAPEAEKPAPAYNNTKSEDNEAKPKAEAPEAEKSEDNEEKEQSLADQIIQKVEISDNSPNSNSQSSSSQSSSSNSGGEGNNKSYSSSVSVNSSGDHTTISKAYLETSS